MNRSGRNGISSSRNGNEPIIVPSFNHLNLFLNEELGWLEGDSCDDDYDDDYQEDEQDEVKEVQEDEEEDEEMEEVV